MAYDDKIKYLEKWDRVSDFTIRTKKATYSLSAGDAITTNGDKCWVLIGGNITEIKYDDIEI